MKNSAQGLTYDQYLQSTKWKMLRISALSAAEWRCQSCGGQKRLEVHHLHYNNFGNETLSDVKVLCHACHKVADYRRETSMAFHNGLTTFGEKLYGEDWMIFPGADRVEEEFEKWLEAKEHEWD